MHQEGVQPDSVKDMVVLNACASIVALEEGTCAHEQIIQVDGIQIPLWVVAWLTCMQYG
jgi:hypothetical protein